MASLLPTKSGGITIGNSSPESCSGQYNRGSPELAPTRDSRNGRLAMQSHLSVTYFHSESAAYEYVEARLWPDGPICPHCGATKEQVGRLRGKTNRIGLCKCYA